MSSPLGFSQRERIDRRLRELEGSDGKSLAELFSSGQPVDLISLAVMQTGIRCRTLDGRSVTLRPRVGIRKEAEAHILTVQPLKTWTFKRTTFLSGEILGIRLDVAVLKLTPLKLRDEWLWDPKKEYWGEPGEKIDRCFKPLIAAGPRPSFEMEQILPGHDPEDMDSDPIGQAVDLYEAGVAIGNLSLPADFKGSWIGGGSITGPICAVCTASGFAAGSWGTRKGPARCSSGCFGSTRATIRASVSACPQWPTAEGKLEEEKGTVLVSVGLRLRVSHVAPSRMLYLPIIPRAVYEG